MFDVAPTELLLVAIVALVVIGPKDLPRVLRVIGQWVGKAKRVAGQFRSGFDEMIRESELAEMEKKWAEENTRIMAEHPAIALACQRELGFAEDVVNVEGGAIAHGHPIGATGAVLTTRLLHAMQRDGLRRGVVTLCIGGGQAVALALERI